MFTNWVGVTGQVVAKGENLQLEIKSFTMPSGKVRLLFQSWGKGGEYRTYSLGRYFGTHDQRVGAAHFFLHGGGEGLNPREFSKGYARKIVLEVLGGKRPHPPIS